MNNQTVEQVCKILSEKQAQDVCVVDLHGMSAIADYFVVCSGKSVAQVKSLGDNLEEQMEKLGKKALRTEGKSEGRWVAVDYGDVVVHVFYRETREIYALDVLWNNGNNVTKFSD